LAVYQGVIGATACRVALAPYLYRVHEIAPDTVRECDSEP
jgi:hypothetical protein